jgi:hypothetical protein
VSTRSERLCSRSSRLRWLCLAACALAGCGGSGPYGFSRTYDPLIGEKKHLERAQELPYEQVKATPYEYRATEIAWFGVVSALSELPDKRTQARLAFHVHQARHLCRDEYEDSCRVTVSESSPGDFSARLLLPESQNSGKERVWVGSLLKVYGKPTGDFDEQGDPVIEVTYFRHWPRGYYVTTAQRAAMRR